MQLGRDAEKTRARSLRLSPGAARPTHDRAPRATAEDDATRPVDRGLYPRARRSRRCPSGTRAAGASERGYTHPDLGDRRTARADATRRTPGADRRRPHRRHSGAARRLDDVTPQPRGEFRVWPEPRSRSANARHASASRTNHSRTSLEVAARRTGSAPASAAAGSTGDRRCDSAGASPSSASRCDRARRSASPGGGSPRPSRVNARCSCVGSASTASSASTPTTSSSPKRSLASGDDREVARSRRAPCCSCRTWISGRAGKYSEPLGRNPELGIPARLSPKCGSALNATGSPGVRTVQTIARQPIATASGAREPFGSAGMVRSPA